MKKIRIALIGAGRIAEWHIRAWKNLPGVEIAAIANRSSSRAEMLARRHGIPIHTRGIERIWDLPGLDAIDVCSPAETHTDLVCRALERGLHVYCEKPLATSGDEARRIIEANSRSRHILFNGFNLRFWPEHQRVTEILREERLGPIRHLSITRNTLHIPAASNARRAHIAFELSSHYIDLILAWMKAEPVRIEARGFDILGHHHPDSVTLTFDFDNGARAEIRNSLAIPGLAPEISIVGTKGVVHVRHGKVIFEAMLAPRSAGGMFWSAARRGAVLPWRLIRNPFSGSCRHFRECIVRDEISSCDETAALATIEIAEKCVTALADQSMR